MNNSALLDRMTLWRILVFVVLLGTAWQFGPQFRRAAAQQAEQGAPETMPAGFAEAERRAQAALGTEPVENPPVTSQPGERIDVWELYLAGGVLMIPITLMSLLTVAISLERLLGLRRRKVLAPRLLRQLRHLAAEPEGLDPRQAFWFCQHDPSTASRVIRAMLLKVGRPLPEVEHAMAEASEREAARLYSNVRWLNLCASVTPLVGLLGTVQGMIQAFFVTAHLPVGVNRAESLAQGIYVALVTTFGGLVVAIPAAILAHLFEGRIQRLFRELDEMLVGLLPQFERFEGKVRVGGKDPLNEYRLETVTPTGQMGALPELSAVTGTS